MAIRVMTSVWDFSSAAGTELLVLLALADNANEETGLAWPSVQRLAAKTRVSERTVQRALRALEEGGQITMARPGGRVGGENKPAVYRLHPQGRQIVTPEGPGATPGAERGDTSVATGVTPVSPKPLVEPSGEPSARRPAHAPAHEAAPLLQLVPSPTPPPARRKPAKVGGKPVSEAEHDLADAALAAFNAAAGTRYTAVEFREKVIRRLREHPELGADELAAVTERVFAAPWWRDDPTPAVIYGNAGIFERSLQARGVRRESERERVAREQREMGEESIAALERLGIGMR